MTNTLSQGRELPVEWDAIVVGSGFGGSMAAHELVAGGWRVLMLERGDWVRRGRHNWGSEGFCLRSDAYSLESAYRTEGRGHRGRVGAIQSVGGASVFYGGVSLRYRTQDFEPCAEITGGSGAEWPFDYEELEPWYSGAEGLLSVAGEEGRDPTEPWRSTPYPARPGALAPASRMIWEAAESLGLAPFRLPLAINHRRANGLAPCVSCTTCDGFACAVRAKNDLATAVLPVLMRRGLRLETNQVVTRLVHDGERITALETVDRLSGQALRLKAGVVVLAGGALASPHLVLASGLHEVNPAGELAGRFLTRHWNAAVMGAFVHRPNAAERFHKQVGIHDLYLGDGELGKLGAIQQIASPPPSVLRTEAGRSACVLAAPLLPRLTGLLVIAEDQPRHENQVSVDHSRADAYGLPVLCIRHEYSSRDRRAGAALVRQAKRILRRAGSYAACTHEIRTFSHALGTLRMGADPSLSVLDPHGRFRGLENLYVTDGSALPTSAGVNPSLTIAANALRIGAGIARGTTSRDLEPLLANVS
jgi:choline dehydrogenase-like flavoprotein